MKIENSNVSLESTNYYKQTDIKETKSIVLNQSAAAKVDLSAFAEKLAEGLRSGTAGGTLSGTAIRERNSESALSDLFRRMRGNQASAAGGVELSADGSAGDGKLTIEILRRILAGLRGERTGADVLELRRNQVKSFNETFTSIMKGSSPAFGPIGDSSANAPQHGTVMASEGGMNRLTRISVESGYHEEHQAATFQGTGMVTTSDGREISFNVTVGMTRSFAAEYASVSAQDYIAVDPLVINMDGAPAKISDKKFLFDLDSDGELEEISYATGNSGFLALDKNGDGEINNGSELFGTKSGDGFKDLAAYDDDGNGWIDENDEVFSRLKIWSIDDEGNQKLEAIGKAGVGAIYLGNVRTDFTLDGQEGTPNGFIRSTGIFLKEDGGAGTVQHVDLTL